MHFVQLKFIFNLWILSWLTEIPSRFTFQSHFSLGHAWSALNASFKSILPLWSRNSPRFHSKSNSKWPIHIFCSFKNEWIAVWKPLYLNNVMYFWVKQDICCVESEQILIVKSGHYTVKKRYLKGCNRLSLGSTLKRDNFAPYLSLKGAY